MLAARAVGAKYVLEVNAPVVDYPGSPKSRIDRALLVQPMRRWRDRQVRAGGPDRLAERARSCPDWVPSDRVLEIEWGADTVRFHPDGGRRRRVEPRSLAGMTAVFAGAFRAWHGAAQSGRGDSRCCESRGLTDVQAVLIGDGPERAAVEDAARGLDRVIFTGAVAHSGCRRRWPPPTSAWRRSTSTRHPPLRTGLLLVAAEDLRYMASGLPVVCPGLPRLRALVGDQVEGVLLRPGDDRRAGRRD